MNQLGQLRPAPSSTVYRYVSVDRAEAEFAVFYNGNPTGFARETKSEAEALVTELAEQFCTSSTCFSVEEVLLHV